MMEVNIKNFELFPMARNTDPKTSHDAAEQHAPKLSERRKQTLILVFNYPARTSGELARLFYQRYGDTIPLRVCAETAHKRLPELEKLGLVERGKERICSDSGYKSVTWYTTLEGVRLISKI